MSEQDWANETLLIHAGRLRSQFDETSEAIWMTSGYVYKTAEEAESAFKNDGSRFVYSRYRNPTVDMFERRMALYEGAERAFATSSGMAAVYAALAAGLKAGDRIVAPHALFGSCLYIINDILGRFGVQATLVDGTDLAQWREALSRPANIVFLESPANPMLDIVDIREVAKLAHAAGALVVVDNVFATPVLQKPLQLGADVVVYSATKHIDGQGRCLGGVILCSNAYGEKVAPFLRHTGPSLSPFNAWVLLKGLETLELRVARHVENAAKLAAALEHHPKIERLSYPGLKSHPQHALAAAQMKGGFGNLIAFNIKGGKDGAFAALNRLQLIAISNNLGDAKSLITHPATTTHQRLTDAERARVGITDGTVRLSVGLENADDLLKDLTNALG
ncbi:O-succinylhomoserine sulfhydrylase [Roseiterribacter gracilis]|uniref:O-succinylhomoserine sulfhydrylase n=1 Tax=Roseiterribacter gracilis TaxID=2812848 RepID=A0A8S8XC40_9PROT|nr:O-succinylhomoserine sulfhydrylase [Rhodospirillales bacterium TMPK1]